MPLSLALGTSPVCVHLILVAAAGSYDWRQGHPFSVVPYAVWFGALPAFVVLALPGQPPPPGWLAAAGACLGAGAHFANVLPDLDDDAAPACVACPTGSGRQGARWPRRVSSSRPPSVLALGAPVPAALAWGVPVVAAAVLAAGFRLSDARPGSRALVQGCARGGGDRGGCC